MATKYTSEQLSKMAVNPELPGRLVDHYPHLGELLHKCELTHGDDSDKLIKYLAWVYDPASPMAKSFTDPRERKKHAEERTKYKYTDAHRLFTVLFLQQVVRSMEYRVILAKEHAFGEYEERVYDPIDTGEGVKDTDIIAATQKKSALLKEMREIAQELPQLKEHFYGGDKELEQAAERKVFTPEGIAGRVKK